MRAPAFAPTSTSAHRPAGTSARVPARAATLERLHVVAGAPSRRGRCDRRAADRRQADLGSPYGTERRSGSDDRLGDRRGDAQRAAGIGLTRDYFSQVAERVTTDDTGLDAGDLVRFHD